jgi:hypothetical protein
MSFAVQTALASQITGSVMVLMTAYMLLMKLTAHSAGMESSGAVWNKLFNDVINGGHDHEW